MHTPNLLLEPNEVSVGGQRVKLGELNGTEQLVILDTAELATNHEPNKKSLSLIH